MSVAIVTDSTAYLPEAMVSGAPVPITVIPLHVVLGGTEHREGVDISTDDLSAALRRFIPVSTSRPAPQVFLDAYEAAVTAGATSIVSIHLSADMSGTCQSAQLAAQQSPVPVEVVDSRSLGMAMGYAVLSAAQASADDLDAQAVAAVALARSTGATVAFYVDTLEHLRRGGRIGAAAALVGSALAIKPLLSLVDGSIRPLERVRTSSRAIARLAELAVAAAESAAGTVDIAVQHLDSPERAEALAEQLRGRVPNVAETMVGELGAVVGAHVGPGTLAVVVSPRPS
ncbi:MAG: DegV family protein [Actinomycetota bacterium]|nr:DegV family protein [Actinomycetota bacterium]